jgi:hypothetical protein
VAFNRNNFYDNLANERFTNDINLEGKSNLYKAVRGCFGVRKNEQDKLKDKMRE